MRIPLEFPDQSEAPPEWTPLEAVVVVKFIDGDGVVRLQEATTASLNVWEAVGMLTWAIDSLRAGLQQATDATDEE